MIQTYLVGLSDKNRLGDFLICAVPSEGTEGESLQAG